MNNSLFKYIDERSDENGRPLFWPGGPGGFPFRGPVPPDLTENEYENLKITGDFYVRTFWMNDVDDVTAYRNIMDRVNSGWFYIRDRDRVWSEKQQCHVIYLEWVQVYNETRQGRIPYQVMGDPNERAR